MEYLGTFILLFFFNFNSFADSVSWSVKPVKASFLIKGFTPTSANAQMACHFESTFGESFPTTELKSSYKIVPLSPEESRVELIVASGHLSASSLKSLKTCGYEIILHGHKNGSELISSEIALAGSGYWNAPSEAALESLLKDSILNEKIETRLQQLTVTSQNGVICSTNKIDGAWDLSSCH